MKKVYLSLILFVGFMSAQAQTDCSTAVIVSEGTVTLPASPTENYYWYEFTMPAVEGKLEIELPNSNGVYIYDACGSSSLYADQRSIYYTDAAPNQTLKIRIGAGNAESFDWTLNVSSFVSGDVCDLAVVANEGTNTVPATATGDYWYTFTMPNISDARIFFDKPDFNFADIVLFRGTCDNLTDETNVIAGGGFFVEGYAANEQFYIRLRLNEESDFDWSIEIEETELGQDCNLPGTPTLGTNVLPATQMTDYWFMYTTPSDVAGKKLQASAKKGVEMSIYRGFCSSSALLQTRDSTVFTLEPEANTNYYFRFNNLEGGDFDWTLSLADPVQGDICADPIIVGEGQHQADYTPQWYSFTATEAAAYSISSTVESSDKDTFLKIYDSCGGSIRAENNDASFSTLQSEIVLDLQGDETILILWESDQFETQEGFKWTIYNESRQQITFNQLEERTFGEDPFELDAISSSGLEVSYTSGNTNVATIDGNIVTILSAGETIITASQAGNNEFDPAIAVEQTLIVTKANQEITITNISDKFTYADPFQVEASSTSGLALTYEVSGPATIDGSTLTLEGTIGTVEVTVRQIGSNNFNLASETVIFEVIEDPCLGFAVTATTLNTSCAGSSDGSITVETTEGSAPFTFSLNDEATVESSIFEGLSAGEYTVLVTDDNGCTATVTATITSPEALEINSEVVNSNSILGNGSISITVVGGTGEYSYSWSNGASTANLEDLEIGEYSVEIADESGCTISETFTIGGVTANETTLEENFLLYPNPARDVVNVQHEEQSGFLKLYDARGTLLNEIAAEGTKTQLNISQLPTGLYFIKQEGPSQLLRFIKE